MSIIKEVMAVHGINENLEFAVVILRNGNSQN